MGDKSVFLTAVFGLGFLLGLFVGEASARRETDAQKWERLQKHREARRATERRYEACVAERLRECLK